MNDKDEISDEFLRTLDERSSQDGSLHNLIVATTSFGMRGMDYRAKNKGIALIVAASFGNRRAAMQGLSRVGRFGDQCKRIGLKNVHLVDAKQELTYTGMLVAFMNQNQKNKINAQLPKMDRKRTTATTPASNATNTAKSTPAVGKSGKAQK